CPRVALDVLELLSVNFGVDVQMGVVGAHPHDMGLGPPVGEQRRQHGEVPAGGEFPCPSMEHGPIIAHRYPESMAELDGPFFVVGVQCGARRGFGLGRNGEDRVAGVAACVASAAVGAVSWTVATPGTTPETAGAALTVGCLAALLTLLVTGRRTAPSR